MRCLQHWNLPGGAGGGGEGTYTAFVGFAPIWLKAVNSGEQFLTEVKNAERWLKYLRKKYSI